MKLLKYLNLTIFAMLLSWGVWAVGPVTGTMRVCAGSTVLLYDTTLGGVWSSGNVAVATVDSSSGLVTGVSAGTVNITYTQGGTSVYSVFTVNALPFSYPFVGGGPYCDRTAAPHVATYGGSASGIVYQLYYNGAATGSPIFGSGSDIDFGPQSLTGMYFMVATNPVTGCATGHSDTAFVSVLAAPAAMVSPSVMCTTATATATDTSSGGVWISSNPSVIAINSAGVLNALTPGTSVITYSFTATGCAVAHQVTVNLTPASLSGATVLCPGVFSYASSSTYGGFYSSSMPSVASINSFGYVSALSPGVTTISYTLSSGCSSNLVVTVNVAPAPISGPSSFCSGSTAGYISTPTGGAWSSSAASIMTIGSSSGVATGVVAGASTLTYSYSGCTVTKPVTVNVQPAAISGATTGCSGNVTALSSTSGGAWSSGNAAVATVSSTGLVTCVSPGTAIINYVLPSSCGVNATVTVSAPPATYAVSSGGTYCAGGSGIHVSLLASDAGINYRLYYGSTVMATLPGTGSMLDFGAETASGSYTVTATDPALGSCTSAMSGTAVIAINPVPTAYSVSTATGGGYCAGASGDHILLAGSDLGVSYQMYNSGSAVGTPIFGTGSLLDMGAAPAGTYTVLATNALTGCAGAMASSATTFAVAPPTVYNLTGGGGYCIGGLGAHIGLSGSDTGVNYQLYHSGVPVGSSFGGSGSTIDFGSNAFTGSYSVIATNAHYGCTSAMSGAASVYLQPLPSVYNATGGASFCPGGSSHIILSNSASGNSYQLYRNGAAAGSAFSGTGTAINFGAETLAGTYFVVATNISTHCADTMYGRPAIVVEPLPTQYAVTGGGAFCALGPGVHISISGSETGIAYSLYEPGGFVVSGVSGTGGTLDFGAHIAAGNYFVVAHDPATGCSDTMTGTATVVVDPLPLAYTVMGGGTYCPGGSGVAVSLSGSESGVSYQLYDGSSPVGVSTSGSGGSISFGVISGAGTYTVMATNSATGCVNNMASHVSVNISSLPTVYLVTGGGSYCSGGTGVHIALSGSTPDYTYHLYNGTSLVGVATGTGTTVDFGPEIMAGSYTVTATNAAACTNSMSGVAVVNIIPSVTPSVTVTVNTGDTVCEGTRMSFLAHGVNGGTSPTYQWFVNGANVAVDSSFAYIPTNGDVVYAILNSSATCVSPSAVSSSSVVTTVIPYPVVTGSSSLCIGSSATLSSEAGGAWSSNDPSVAAVAIIGGTPGVVIGRSAGTTTITYTIGPGCSAYVPVTVNALPTVNVTPSAENCGGSRALTATGADTYSWSPANGLSCTGCAGPDANPTATTLYTVKGTDAVGCSNTATVNFDADRIYGYVSYSGGTATDSIKVWLINFNPSDSVLTGLDSTYTCAASGGHYFEFADKAAGNYMVKAELLGQTPGNSGYIPTYSLSSAHWYSAATVAHNGGDDQMNVHLLYGTVPSGRGFIAGLVSTGANRGTVAPAPAKGMTIYLEDAFTHQVLAYVYTDSAGKYSFGHLAAGTYIIYPEKYGYSTTPSQAVYVTIAADSVQGIDFQEHTLSKTITPEGVYASNVQNVAGGANMTIYPNPASDVLYINWSNAEEGEATIVIADITGKEVSRKNISVSSGSGSGQTDLTGLVDGVYLVTIQAPWATRTSKLVIQH